MGPGALWGMSVEPERYRARHPTNPVTQINRSTVKGAGGDFNSPTLPGFRASSKVTEKALSLQKSCGRNTAIARMVPVATTGRRSSPALAVGGRGRRSKPTVNWAARWAGATVFGPKEVMTPWVTVKLAPAIPTGNHGTGYPAREIPRVKRSPDRTPDRRRPTA